MLKSRIGIDTLIGRVWNYLLPKSKHGNKCTSAIYELVKSVSFTTSGNTKTKFRCPLMPCRCPRDAQQRSSTLQRQWGLDLNRPDEMELSGFPICWEIGCCQGLFHDDQLSLQYAWVEGTSSLPCIVCSGFGYKNGKCLTSFIVFQEKFDEYCHPISLLCSPMLISQYSVLLNISSFVQPPFFWFESLVSNGPGKKNTSPRPSPGWQLALSMALIVGAQGVADGRMNNHYMNKQR